MSPESTQVADYEIPELIENLNSPGFRLDPYPYYRRMREHAPLFRAADRWIVTRHDDCNRALRDPRWTQVPEDLTMCLPDRHAYLKEEAGDQREKPHDLRAFLSKEFTSKSLRQFEPRVQAAIDELLSNALEAGEVDLIDSFAAPLTGFVSCELFAVPASERTLFSDWVEAIVRRVDIAAEVSDEEIRRHDEARSSFREYFRELIAERRRRPGDDILSKLVAFEDDKGRMSEEDLLDSCIFILIASHRAPSESIGLGTLALSGHPEERARLESDPGLAPTAVEELLRFDGPAQIAPRLLLDDVELHGQTLRQGEIVLLMLGAANRDPDVFPDPDRLDLSRQPNPHLTFGQGRHFCAGAGVGRLVLRVAFTTLLRRAPHYEISGEPVWTKNVFLRGLAKLPIVLR